MHPAFPVKHASVDLINHWLTYSTLARNGGARGRERDEYGHPFVDSFMV